MFDGSAFWTVLLPWLMVIAMSMLPFVELRGSIPLGILVFGLPPVHVMLVAILANMIPVPFILILFEKVEAWLRRWKWWADLMDRVFERTRRKANDRVEKYEALALILFVGIPLPGTGAWTGSLIAYLFGLDIRKSFFYIAMGVVIAGMAITGISMGLIGHY